jgi:hypothetical protein
MKKVLFTIAALFFLTFTYAQSPVHVKGYTKSNGTYVDAHYRTAPNETINDNWSTKPNVNPYTGKVGTVSPTTYSNTGTYSVNISDIVAIRVLNYQNSMSIYKTPSSDLVMKYMLQPKETTYK